MKILKIIVIGLFLGSLVACKTTGSNTATTETKKEVKTDKKVAKKEQKKPQKTKVIDGSNAPKGSKFSRLKLNMSAQQVYDTIGRPTDRKVYSTGKAWVPFYYGSDRTRQEYLYKGEGRLTIGGNGRLIAIYVDPTEDGYR
ncbi:MAG: hypothetical protein ACRBEE_09385 [Arenicella sp.]